MKTRVIFFMLLAIAQLCCLAVAQSSSEKPRTSTSTKASAHTPARAGDEKPVVEAERQAKPAIEKEKQKAQQEAQKSVNNDAVEAIQQTQKAIDAIQANRQQEAIADIEQATGKVNILLARNPSTALIPMSVEVNIIDTAPHDIQKIRDIAAAASWAVEGKDFPAARVLLQELISEIRVRTTNLPLATYPTALQEAARLLDQKKNAEASSVLQTALNTLMIVDKVTPLPLVVAREAVNVAQSKSQQDKATAKILLDTAKLELQRAKELRYAGRDQEYAFLSDEISTLQKQLNGGADTASLYDRLKQRLEAFLNRQSQHENGQPQQQRTSAQVRQ